MARKQPEDRRRELLEIATRQFFHLGYEKTSIRSIVGEAQGEIGMFYHHFSSKDAIFEAVMEHFSEVYTQNMRHILQETTNAPFPVVLDEILSALEASMLDLKAVVTGAVDTQMLQKLHEKTLLSLSPILVEALGARRVSGALDLPDCNLTQLTTFMLFGISAVIHDKSIQDWQSKKKTVRAICFRLLGLSQEK